VCRYIPPWRARPTTGTGTRGRSLRRPALQTRKASLHMSTQPERGPRRIKAAIIGFGLDAHGGLSRLTTSDSCVLLGGSADTHAEMLETVLRLDSELERIGQPLSEVSPSDLAEIAWRIDSPELHRIAVRLHDGLQRRGRAFCDSTAEELTELSA
jgi:hypothetical protein